MVMHVAVTSSSVRSVATVNLANSHAASLPRRVASNVLNNPKDPQSPDFWLLKLGVALNKDLPRLRKLDAYDRGDHPLPYGNRKLKETFQRLQPKAKTNYTGLVVESLRERLRPIGIRSGADAAEGQDKTAWDLWQANSMDAEIKVIIHRALAMGRSYALIGQDEDGEPLITSESPLQCYHMPDPQRPRKVAASLKTWIDPFTNRAMANVYDDDRVYHYMGAGDKIRWEDVAFWTATEVEEHGAGQNPMVPFICRRERSNMGFGEFEDVLPVQDRINLSILDRLVIQAMQAYRQRGITGWAGVTNPETGQKEIPFDPGADMLWGVGDKDAKFYDFQQADLTQIIRAVADDVKDLAAITRTPPHYLLANVANVSGDALASAESGLMIKARDRIAEFTESAEEVLRLAATFAGYSLPDDAALVWEDTERHTLAERADAAAKWAAAGVPKIAVFLMLGFSQAEAEALVKQSMKEALVQQAQMMSAGGGFPSGGPNSRPSPNPGPPGAKPDAGNPNQRPGPTK
jgi:hypothetical protein